MYLNTMAFLIQFQKKVSMNNPYIGSTDEWVMFRPEIDSNTFQVSYRDDEMTT